jgi:hypothetical protein
MDYRRALARSPDELDALLDRQATTGAPPDKQFTPVTMLTLSASNDRSLPGDL